ncbi:hypothetical protein [Sphingomonas sp. TREG-RG-20F-R18-01]|uniref:hypothetical protein n=1 Tax=Sphingomonas sp. TREG-RG-20F-R18-01 TaxID=2914982 RepID=UPI001F58846A|nr:hypothetical protein [Sphingomonas sp. TREG-RG-20F-R18-01]
MAADVSNSLAGLSILTRTNEFATYGATATSTTAAVETAAQRKAHAQFKTPATTAPWTQARTQSPSVAAVQGLKTIVDASVGAGTLPHDVQTDFTTYKALDRLRVLAQAAASSGTNDAQRRSLQQSFGQGLKDLQAYLGSTLGDQLQLAFDQPHTRAESIAIGGPPVLPAIVGKGVVADRTAPLSGVTGTERLRVTLSQGDAKDVVDVDLSQAAQPPTLDGIATAITSAIAAVPARATDGTIQYGADGAVVPRWNVQVRVTKTGNARGLTIDRTGNERIAIDQPGAPSTLVVASDVTSATAPPSIQVLRVDDPAEHLAPRLSGTISATDRLASATAALRPPPAGAASAGRKPPPPAPPAPVAATTTGGAVIVDPDGFSYVVGTTQGDLGSALSNGNPTMFLSKRDSAGNAVWQRELGRAGASQGAALALAPGGGVVIAGTVSDGASPTGNGSAMMVARYATNGDELFSQTVRASTSDTASAVAVAGDGTIFLGGRTASGGGNAYFARLDPTGRMAASRTVDSGGDDRVTALALDKDGQVLALTQQGSATVLQRLDAVTLDPQSADVALGAAQGRALAVAADGMIAVGGTTLNPVAGDQVNAPGGGRDGFVTRISADFGQVATTYLATAGDDQVDSIGFLGDALYVGGRTTGTLGTAQQGKVDGFVGRIDLATGAVASVAQFGTAGSQVGPVRLATDPGGATILDALGLHRGVVTPDVSANLVAQTSVRVGDSVSISINHGPAIQLTIGASDTVASLASRVGSLTGGKATVTSTIKGDGRAFQITARGGATIALIAGPPGQDALAKLGIDAQVLSQPPVRSASAPKVAPGGQFGLGLSTALSLASAQDAGIALNAVKQAMSITQTGYRSLYWDSTKAALADGGSGTTSKAAVARANAQAASYQAALDRIASSAATTSTTPDLTLTVFGLNR